MRALSLAAKAWRLLVLTALAVVCLPAFAVVRYVPVSPTVVAQTADPHPLRRKVSEAPFGDFRTEAHPGGDCGGGQNTLTCQAPYTFTGHLYDQESGLYYFGARYYDPETGRFLSQDPVAGDALNPPSLHKYLYAYSSPLNYTDPWGEQVAGPESRYKQQVVVKMSPEEREKYLRDEAEFNKGMIFDAPAEVAKETLEFVPNMVRLVGEGSKRTYADARRFIADVESHGVGKAVDNYTNIVQERDAESVIAFQEGMKDWAKKMEDPRFAGKETMIFLVGLMTAVRGALEVPEALVGSMRGAKETGERLFDAGRREVRGTEEVFKDTAKAERRAAEQLTTQGIEEIGSVLERQAAEYAESLGEKVLRTHYQQGAAEMGFDLGSVRGRGLDAKFIVTEAKNVKGVARESTFSTFGLGRSGSRTYEKALEKALEAIDDADLDSLTKRAVKQQIRERTFEIRLVGSASKGTQFTPDTIQAIRESTGVANVQVTFR